MTDTPASRDEEIRAFWNARREPDGILPLDQANDRAGFQEHPVWMGVILGLLTPADGGRPIRRVADLGCGTGMVAEMAARLGHEVIAIDFAPARAEQAAARLAPFSNVEVRVGDATAPPLEVGEVDAIISRNMLWLLTDPATAIRSWVDRVGAGGRVAAIDSTRRTSRSRMSAIPRIVRRGARAGAVTAGSPVSAAAPTPFSDIHGVDEAARFWIDAGAPQVRGVDLSWVSGAWRSTWPVADRLLRRDRYFAVVSDPR